MYHLTEMLTYKRRARTKSEEEFIQRYLDDGLGTSADEYGNRILRIGTAPVLWCAHTDTVHDTNGRQKVKVNRKGMLHSENGECLGADNGTGVWLLCEMARMGVEGLYVFHREEESGALGSQWIARHTPELLDGILYAIAFDRRGYDSIVTHQAGYRTASDEFAWALADLMDLNMSPDPTGVFTDTESYADLIPECTNVSIGYHHAHRAKESQDVGFAGAVLRSMLDLDIAKLPVVRDPVKCAWADDAAPYFPDRGGRFNRDWDKFVDDIALYPEVAAEMLYEAGFRHVDLEYRIIQDSEYRGEYVA